MARQHLESDPVMVSCHGEYGPPRKIATPTALKVLRRRRKARGRKLQITETYSPASQPPGRVLPAPTIWRRRSTAKLRCLDAVTSGSRKMKKMQAASMESNEIEEITGVQGIQCMTRVSA